MGKKKSYSIHFIHNGKNPDDAIKDLISTEFKKVLEKNNAKSYNLDEVVNKYVSGEMCIE